MLKQMKFWSYNWNRAMSLLNYREDLGFEVIACLELCYEVMAVMLWSPLASMSVWVVSFSALICSVVERSCVFKEVHECCGLHFHLELFWRFLSSFC